MVPTKRLEILTEEAIRTFHADGGEEESERSQQREQSSRCGTTSRRRVTSAMSSVVGHLMSCSSSATSASLLEHRALRTLAVRNFYQHIFEHFLTCCESQFANFGRRTKIDLALPTHSNAQYMFWGATPSWQHIDGCPYVCGKLPNTGVCDDGNCFLHIAHEKLFSCFRVVNNRSKTGLVGQRRMGVPSGHVVQ